MLRYYQHFGLQRDPFLDTSDPQFYLELPSVRRNMRRILTAIEESRGLAVVIGPSGSGKTSMSSALEQTLLGNSSVSIGKILDPTFANDVEFLLAITRVFGLDLKSHSTADLKNALKNFLFDAAIIEKSTLVLLIDEAQNLTADGLEMLRLLLNFQVPQKKLLNLVLFGEEELATFIAAHESLSDRIDTYVRLDVLDAAASTALVEHRLVKAGKLPVVDVFAPAALQRAVEAGGGLPRRLTNVVRWAMVEAADRGAEVVTMDHVIAALRAHGMKATSRTSASDPAVSETPSISEDINVKEPLRAEQGKLLTRFLAWFP
jgi:type II secretory pathway predicted ATPase ExeA